METCLEKRNPVNRQILTEPGQVLENSHSRMWGCNTDQTFRWF